MDRCSEQIIKKNKTLRDIIKIIVLLLIATIINLGLSLLLTTSLFPLAILLMIGVIALTWRLISNISCEFEYINVNGEMNIDLIIAKRKRARIITVNARDVTAYGKLEDLKENSSVNNLKIINCSDRSNINTYYLEVKNSIYGQTRVLFTPNNKTRENFELFLSRNLIRK